MFTKFLYSILLAAFAVGGLGSLTACNTIEGIGKDLQAGGAELREEAREHRR